MKLIGILLIVFTITNCAVSDTIPQKDAQSQILAAMNAKSKECNTTAVTILPVVIDVPQRNLDLCTIAILRSECPLVQYPLACVLIYFDKSLGEFPKLFNFNELINRKI
jgi:hypothetical protein